MKHQNPYTEEEDAKAAILAIDRVLHRVKEYSEREVAFAATVMKEAADFVFKDQVVGVLMMNAATLLIAARAGKLVRKGADTEAEEQRRNALNELAKQAQELKMGY